MTAWGCMTVWVSKGVSTRFGLRIVEKCFPVNAFGQPSATHPHFWQTCILSSFLTFGTTNCGYNLWEIYAPQTKILESRTNISDRVFKALFAYVSTSFGRLTIEKCFENTVRNVFFGFPKSSFGRGRFVKKWGWRLLSERLVRPSTIFVWEG